MTASTQDIDGPGEEVSRSPVRQTRPDTVSDSYPQLVGLRVCLGITEAGLAPGVFF